MKKQIKIVISALVVVLMLVSFYGCQTADTGDFPMPTSKISGHEANITPNVDFDIIKTEIKEVEKLDIPKDKGSCDSFNFESLDEMFSLCGYAVYGKVISASEINCKDTYKNGDANSFYSSLIELEVIKNLGGQELVNKENNIIRIAYAYCSYEYYKGIPELEQGDECIMFLSDTSKIKAYTSQDYYEYAPYYMVFPYEYIIEKYDDGFNAYTLMSFANGKKIINNMGEERIAKCYSLAEIEEVISANKDKLIGLTYEEFINSFLKRERDSD
ncbi:MAG: hypothetical protein GX802_00160 [Clostridiales bacterium]|nr:hypothetical protein [Clostridiales bacterium]